MLNAANEEAVAQFLEERIHFLDIPDVIETACERHKIDFMDQPQLDDVLSVDQWARQAVREAVQRATRRMTLTRCGGVSGIAITCCSAPRASKAKCCDPTVGAASWDRLKQLVKQLGLEDPGRAAQLTTQRHGLSALCERGPVLLIWPDGCWYGEVTPERLDDSPAARDRRRTDRGVADSTDPDALQPGHRQLIAPAAVLSMKTVVAAVAGESISAALPRPGIAPPAWLPQLAPRVIRTPATTGWMARLRQARAEMRQR